MNRRSITVVGAGGIGATLGWAFREAVQNVTYVERNPAKYQQKLSNNRVIPFENWVPLEHDTILLCVKCFDNKKILERLPDRVELIPIQNGYDPQLESKKHVAAGIASFVAQGQSGGIGFTVTRPGKLQIGSRFGQPLPSSIRSFFQLIQSPLKRQRITLQFETDIRPLKFTKLLYNSAIAPLAAIAGIDNGQLLSDRITRRLFFALLKENFFILQSAGLELGTVGPFSPRLVTSILSRNWLSGIMAKFFEPSLRGTYCSMSGDIERGQTEIDYYNGFLISLIRDPDRSPINRSLYQLVKQMECDRTPPHPRYLEELVIP